MDSPLNTHVVQFSHGHKAHHIGRIPENVSKYLASHVQGKKYDNVYLPNGDFIIDKSKLSTEPSFGKVHGMKRVTPKAA